MKSKIFAGILTIVLAALAINTFAQQAKIQNWRPYDQRGVNIYEPAKDLDTEFTGLSVRIGGAFAQQYQALEHSNTATESLFPGTQINRNKLYPLAGGFNLATANLNVDVQLADGIRLAVENYMSSRHHEEFWVKGGYIQVDKLPMFGNPDWFSKYVRVKIGHFQVNYGDQQFRRTDNGNAMYNPFVGNYILDAFATEIGGEAYLFPTSDIMLMVGMTNGLINGNIAEVARKPSLYAKAAYDKRISDDFRFRLSGSIYTNPESARNTLYSGDRAGSRFYMVLAPEFAIPRGGTVPVATTATDQFTTGRFNPDFSKNITSIQINPFIKFKGLELFGAFETSSGYNSRENKDTKRSVTQIAVEGLYRFLPNEQLYIGGRYNTLSGELVSGLGDETSIDRIEIVAGWYPIKNLLLKVEYVNQQYKNFPATNIYNGGEFKGMMIEAIVGF